jgi:phenylacetate-coenzyme A ligase PaaK-like adenylate-forming protein
MIATASSTSPLQRLRTRVTAQLAAELADQVERVSWDRERIRAHQRERLRALLAHAVANSPFHARRLAGIDPHRFELSELATLPVLSKAETMGSFDELLTDRRLSRRTVEDHLDASRLEPRLLLDEYVCLASGGSSGLRGVFVQRLDEYMQFIASVARAPLAQINAQGGPPPDGLQIGTVLAASPVHSSAWAPTCSGYPVRFTPAPATLPLAEIVARLNAADPPALQGYPSLLRQLAGERQAGRLRIAPRSVTSAGETLSPDDRDAIAVGFGVPVTDLFVSTEGLVGRSEPGGQVLTFASDLCIVELVDQDNQPVPAGVTSARALVTNLHNLTQPLIRYELTDQFIAHPTGPENGHLRATAQGRADPPFRYGRIEVSAFAIRSVLATAPTVREYQISQTNHGLDAAIIADGELDTRTIAARLADTLRTAGLANPEVALRHVKTIERHADTGKTRRFIPLSG